MMSNAPGRVVSLFYPLALSLNPGFVVSSMAVPGFRQPPEKSGRGQKNEE